MNLKERTASGTKWLALSSIATISISILQLTLLARLLEPKEFGLLTIALMILILVETYSDFGLSNIIIQSKKISETELSTLYWINNFISIGIFVLLFFGSDAIARLLHQPELSIIIETLSVAFIIMPQGQQCRALLQKEMAFTHISIVEISAALVGFLVTMVCAWFKPVALCAIWGFLSAVSLRMLMFCWFGRDIYQPTAVFQPDGVKSRLRYGGFLTADKLLGQISIHLPTIILSRAFGAVITGGYNLALNMAVIAPARVNPILTRVLLPALARIQDDQPRLRQSFYKILAVTGLINFAVLLELMSVANNFVIVMFGAKWLFITPVLQILCVAGLLQTISKPANTLAMATALVDASTTLNMLRLLISIPVLWLGIVSDGIIGAAFGFLAIQVLFCVLNYFYLLQPILGKSGKQYLYSLWTPLKLTLPIYAASYLTGFLFDQLMPQTTLLALQIVSGAVAFILMISTSREAVITEAKSMLFRRIKLHNEINKGNQVL